MRVRALNEIAAQRGQSLAQLAIAWVLRDPARELGADRREQRRPSLEQSLGALANSSFSAEELAEIERHAVDSGIDLWALLE